ncbi:MAG: LCP family protein [Lachnospiraceae bacterium]|nr:LCP family protein [Lachnospiraceae bacterium]
MSKSRKKGKKSKKLGLILLAEILVFAGLVGGYVVYYINHSLDLIQTDETTVKEEINVSDAVTETMVEEYQTIVLYGVDTRDNVDMTKEGVTRSDAVIIASINNKTKEVKLVSVYRDAFLEMARPTPSTQKYTHAYFLGGPTCAMETLNKNLDLNITDYVTVDFKALTNAIDALGGVTINVKSNELNNLNHNLEEQNEVTGIYSEGVWDSGEQLLNGAQATAYARIRKVGNGDFERTQRQRAVVSAMIEKAKKSDLATINELISEIFPQIATNLSKKQLISLAASVFDYELGDNIGFPLANRTPTLGSKGSVVVPADLLSNVEYLHEFLYPEDTNYVPSEEVKRISAAITNETGVYDEFTEDKKTEEPTQTNSTESTTSETGY